MRRRKHLLGILLHNARHKSGKTVREESDISTEIKTEPKESQPFESGQENRILYFVGHYDYLFYAILFDSGLVCPNTKADFIILETANCKTVKNFICRKKKAFTIGRIASVKDEGFLNKETAKATADAIRRCYEKILKKWEMKLQDYDHIYMSFDEWNSFGIYLAEQNAVPPVSVLLKNAGVLSDDIYHYLDTPGKYKFSELQKKYRVLNAEGSYIQDIILLTAEAPQTIINGKTVRCFDVKNQIMNLTEEQYKMLCDFFEFENFCEENKAYNLLLTDSNWFGSKVGSRTFDYLGAYKMFLNYMVTDDSTLIVKKHPRFDVGKKTTERAFHDALILPPYVPAELLTAKKFVLSNVFSVGNPVPDCISEKAGHSFCANNRFFFFYRMQQRFCFAVDLAKYLNISEIYCSGICAEDIANYSSFIDRESERKNFFELQEGEILQGKFIICNKVKKRSFRDSIVPLLRNDNVIIMISPEYEFSLADDEVYAEIETGMTAFKMKKYPLSVGELFNDYEDWLWTFCMDEDIQEKIRCFKFDQELKFSGYRLRSVINPEGKKLILKLRGKCESKDYIAGKALTHPVVIYGATSLAYDFLKKYGKQLNVRYVMTDSMKKVDARLRKNYDVVRYNSSRIRKKDYIIVCKPFTHNVDYLPPYAVTRDRLLRQGFTVCRQFIWYSIFEAAIEQKKLILFCGYCEMSGVKQVLELTSANRDYCMVFYHIGRETMRSAPGYRDFIASAKMCDILIHAPLLVRKGVLDQDILKLVRADTQRIFIPQITFRGYAPYKSIKVTRRNTETRLFGIIHYPFLYEIPFMNKMIGTGKTNEEILAAVKSPDLFSTEEILQNMQLSLRMLEIIDSRSDIPIADYIWDNYRKKMLFKDCIHVGDDLFFEYARRLSRYLGKMDYINEIDSVQKICEENGAYFQVATEEPILPCVAQALQLDFADCDRKYMVKVTEEWIRWETLDEWVNDYCDYYRAIIKVKQSFDPEYCTQHVTILRNEGRKYAIERMEHGY